MNTKTGYRMNYHSMLILALIVGMIGIALQFVPGFELLAFMLTVAVLGGLIGGSNHYREQDRQQLERSYKTTFEWLLLVILAAYTFIELSKLLVIFQGAAAFLNDHWPIMLFSILCILMELAGFQKAKEDVPA